jgi:hypothetical protein
MSNNNDDNDMDVDDKIVDKQQQKQQKKNKAVDDQEIALLPEMSLLQHVFAQTQDDDVFSQAEVCYYCGIHCLFVFKKH